MDDVNVTSTSSAWNAIINTFHGTILGLIKSYLPEVGKAIGGIVDSLNAKMAAGSPFMVSIFDPRFPLNLTTTQPP